MNELAFPMLDPSGGGYTQYGLTKREYFAAMAMQALIQHYGLPKRIDNEFSNPDELDSLLTGCTKIADELLKQLES